MNQTPVSRAALVTAVISVHLPRVWVDRLGHEGGELLVEEQQEDQEHMILQPIYLWKDQSHHSPLCWPSSCP